MMLLRSLAREDDADMKGSLANLVGELATGISESRRDDWSELFQYMTAELSSECHKRQVVGLQLLRELAGMVTERVYYDGHYLAMLQARMRHLLLTGSTKVRVGGLKALSALITHSSTEEERHRWEPCHPSLIPALQAVLSTGDVAASCSCLEMAIEIASEAAWLFKPSLGECVSLNANAAATASVPATVRQLALELLVTLAEEGPVMCRSLGCGEGSDPSDQGRAQLGAAFAEQVIPVCMSVIAQVPDEGEPPPWGGSDVDEEDGSGDLLALALQEHVEVALEALRRVVIALGRASLARAMACVIMAIGAKQQQWQVCFSGLRAVRELGELLDEGQLSQILPLVAAHINNSLPKVRCAALGALAGLSADQAPTVQEQHHRLVAPSLLNSTLTSTNPTSRVRVCAFDATAQFFYNCPHEVAVLYADGFMKSSMLGLQQVSKRERVSSIDSIGALAGMLGEDFGAYYDHVMPALWQLLAENVTGRVAMELKGKTLETITIIGEAVGPDRFTSHAMALMEEMCRGLPSLVNNDHMKPYVLKAWVRICGCVGDMFVKYLPLVMPQLLAALHEGVADEGEGPDASDTGSWAQETANEDTYSNSNDSEASVEMTSVRSAVIEEQALAAHAILMLLGTLQQHMYQYVPTVMSILPQLIVSSPHSDIRTYSIACMPELVRCCIKAEAACGPMLEHCFGLIVNLLEVEPDLELAMTAAQAIKSSIEHTCEGSASYRQLVEKKLVWAITAAVMRRWQHGRQRRSILAAQAVVEEYDQEEKDKAEMEGLLEVEMINNLAEVLSALFKAAGPVSMEVFRGSALPLLKEAVHGPAGSAYCQQGNPAADDCDLRMAAYCYVDALENAPQSAASLVPEVVDDLMVAGRARSSAVRQAAFYGFGVIAQHHGGNEVFRTKCSSILSLLLQSISSLEARDGGEEEAAVDNAVGAVGLIAESIPSTYYPDVPASMLWRSWLDYLPMRADASEGLRSAALLCRMVVNPCTIQCVLGQDYSRLGHALSVLGELLEGEEKERGMECREAAAAAVEWVRALAANATAVPSALAQSAWLGLGQHQREAFARHLGS
ncbi:unnamed protein product [Chrysoparadoxa australica]